MAKRFTDSNKFDDIWYRKLSILQKCIWEYALAKCNHAGFLQVDVEAMEFHIGAKITPDDLECFADRFEYLRPDLVFIPKFIQFQYGELRPNNNAHKSVILELNKFFIEKDLKIPGANEPLGSPCQGDQDKEQDKDNTPDKDIKGIGGVGEKGFSPIPEFTPPTLEEFQKYAAEQNAMAGVGGFACSPETAEQCWSHYQSQGWRKSNESNTPVRDWKGALRLWCTRPSKKAPPPSATSSDDAAQVSTMEQQWGFKR